MSTTLFVIAKAPVPGRSKTRLCPPCTLSEAASLAEAALVDTLEAVRATPTTRHVLALDGAPGRWLHPGFEVVPQRGRGLAARLAAAFSTAGGPALLVGMDTPQITTPLLETCLAALLAPGVDAVLGPALDGGWWTIGLRHADPRVFAGIAMSTADTGAAQLARLRELELTTSLLPTCRDVDTIVDAHAVAREAPTTRFASRLSALRVVA